MAYEEQNFLCVKQRAGPLVKAMVTDNFGYVRRYGLSAARKRCGPALSRTSVDKLELRLALFGYDGVFYTLTFSNENLPGTHADVRKIWNTFMKRLRRWLGRPVDFYVYRIEGLHGDHRFHVHAFLRDSDFPPAVVRLLWDWGEVDDEPFTQKRVLSEGGYRGLAIYFTKETPEVGRHAWGCSRTLSRYLPQPEIRPIKSGALRVPAGAVPLPVEGRDRPQLGEWGLYAYARWLQPVKQC